MRKPNKKVDEKSFLDGAEPTTDKQSVRKTSFDCPTELYKEMKILCINKNIKQKDFILEAITSLINNQ
jgi:hypothetical protein